jgi:hypothetical protein
MFVSDELEPGKYKITAIIDWEMPGFAPWWAQGFRMYDEHLGTDWVLPDLPDGGAQKWKEIHDLMEPMMKAFKDAYDDDMFQHTPRRVNFWGLGGTCAGGGTRGRHGYDDNAFGIPEGHRHFFDLNTTGSESPQRPEISKFRRLWNRLA